MGTGNLPFSAGLLVNFFPLFIAVGASCGAILRWWITELANPLFPKIPLGTLLVNLAGCYAVGVLIGFTTGRTALPEPWRVALTAGFLGSFTTFSAFSAETLAAATNHGIRTAGVLVFLHVGGSVAMTALGLASSSALISPTADLTQY
jgi:CrcB protein